MGQLITATILGIIRDRVFQGIILISLLFLAVPVLSEFSMRQVTELSITLCLSIISFVLLLLSVFLGGASLWRDIERRYTYSVLGLPLRRRDFLLGKFFGVGLFLLLVALFLGLLSLAVIWFVSQQHPPRRPIIWGNVVIAIWLDVLKYILLVGITFIFTSVSTSFFLPIFGAIITFATGSISQQVYDFILTPTGRLLPTVVKLSAKIFYWIVPNFGAFDVKVNAIYSLGLTLGACGQVMLYWLTYLILVLSLASWLFSRREML